jgi:hypothetical protein
MWKREPKDKHIYKNKQHHIQTYMYSMFVIVELFYGTQGRRERKRERVSTVSKYITSVKVEDITVCIESS